MPHNPHSSASSPYRTQSPYMFPSPIMPSTDQQKRQYGAAQASEATVLHRNQSVSELNHATHPGLRRTRSFTSLESSPHISFQPQESRPPLRFYVDDAIHELFSHKQKSGRSKGGAFSLIAGLFACWNPTSKKGSIHAEARSLSASKRVSELLEISKRQQSELADKQDTIDMLEWQLEQMQALALMDSDKEPARRSAVGMENGLAVLQDRSTTTADHMSHQPKPKTDEKEIKNEQIVKASTEDKEKNENLVKPKIEEKENTRECIVMPVSKMKSEEKHITEVHGAFVKLRSDDKEHPLCDCKLKIEKKENKQLHAEAGGDHNAAAELNFKQMHAIKCEEHAGNDKESTMATLLLFEMATMRARFSIRSFSKALIKQMEASGYSVLRTLSELEPNVAFTKKEHVVYTLESRINKAFFHCFENDSFDDSGLMQILDPVIRCTTRLEEFQRMKLVEVDDAVNANHPSFDPDFRRFCQRKTKELWSQFSWHIVFNSVEEREVFTAAFLDAAKSVWLLHRLAFSVNPHVLILRVGKGLEIDPVYVDAVPNLGDGLEGLCRVCGKSKVEFLIMPGFQAMGKVVKCQVYQHVQCLVD
ncbi:hypothetical protein GOP47_0023172 [Adiantum capillus-veneris]|uniref:Uncharacterized protein n=1 Tax=Adiantum capillus-veneris TaxID=13818 RepID=A0A9D4Z4Z5_ADICA|nr:hypothetical protein GOP47_0023172 [Adiantum capillus-veneris]